MKNWFSKNYKTLIIAAFLIPIITVAIVSISHVTQWYGISNPVSWAVYLSIGIEIAALSALAAISANMGKKVYFPFAIVTLIQFIGNIFFAYSFIDINSKSFKDWVDLVSPLVEFIGVESTDFVGHKRFLALFAGGMLPIISLSFLHMLVKFTEEDKAKESNVSDEKPVVLEKEEPVDKIDASDLIGEVSRLRLTEEDLKVLEKHLLNPLPPNEKLKEAAEKYNDVIKSASLKEELALKNESIAERIEEFKVESNKTLDETLDNVNQELDNEPEVVTSTPTIEEEEVIENEIDNEDDNFQNMADEIRRRQEILSEMVAMNQELGLYDDPIINHVPEIDENEIESHDDLVEEEAPIIEDTYNIAQAIKENDVTPALSDEEVHQMFMDEWERKYDLAQEEEYVPSEEDIRLNNELSDLESYPTSEEVQKFNIDSAYNNELVNEELKTDDSFWRDHLNDDEEDEEDLKKK